MFCTELWGGPIWLLCAPVANLGWLVEAGSKQLRAEKQHKGSCDQSDQWCGSKHLTQRCFLDKLCKNLLFLQSSYTSLATAPSHLVTPLCMNLSKKLTWNILSVVNKKLNMIHSSCFFSLSPSFTKQFSSSAPWQQDYVLSLSSDFQGHGSFLFGKPQNVPWIEWSNTKPLLMPRCCESADVKKKKNYFVLFWTQSRVENKHQDLRLLTFLYRFGHHHSE